MGDNYLVKDFADASKRLNNTHLLTKVQPLAGFRSMKLLMLF